MYEKLRIPVWDRAGYYVYDRYLGNAVSQRLAAFYRAVVPRSAPASTV